MTKFKVWFYEDENEEESSLIIESSNFQFAAEDAVERAYYDLDEQSKYGNWANCEI